MNANTPFSPEIGAGVFTLMPEAPQTTSMPGSTSDIGSV